MVRTGAALYGWDHFATKSKPEWKDILARFGKKEPTEAKKGGNKNKKRGSIDETGYEFSSDAKLLDFPGELLDMVLGDESLNLRDHLALAATCRSLRACYYTPNEDNPEATSKSRHSTLWSGLMKLRPTLESGRSIFRRPTAQEKFAVEHIWTSSKVEDVNEMMILGGPDYVEEETKKRKRSNSNNDTYKGNREGHVVIRSKEWNDAIELVHHYRVTKTQAKSCYKLKDNELTSYLYAYCKKNPHTLACGAKMSLFLEASVESLAFRLHGGAQSHYELVKKCQASAAKAQATRERNGTRGRGGRRHSSTMIYTAVDSLVAEG